MPSVKKPKHMEPAVIAHAEAVVAANPRGAPLTIHEELQAMDEAKAALPPCRLDEMPVGSKVVVVSQNDRKTPILVTPHGYVALTPDDVAYGLPMGAKVTRKGESGFVSEQLDPAEPRPLLVTATARDAMALFTAHFHG